MKQAQKLLLRLIALINTNKKQKDIISFTENVNLIKNVLYMIFKCK